MRSATPARHGSMMGGASPGATFVVANVHPLVQANNNKGSSTPLPTQGGHPRRDENAAAAAAAALPASGQATQQPPPQNPQTQLPLQQLNRNAAGSQNNNNNTSSSNSSNANTKFEIEFNNVNLRLTTHHALGKGGFATVYAARSPSGEHYALKVCERVTESNWQRLQEEVRILQMFNGTPGIVKLYAAARVDDTVYLAMERCVSSSLHDIVQNKVLSLGETLWIGHQLLLTLREIHHRNVIHRDLKPQNILFDYDGNVKVIDFGLSSRVGDSDAPRKTIAGTAVYMAPEMADYYVKVSADSAAAAASGQPRSTAAASRVLSYGKEVDVWSYGIVMFVLATRMSPYWHTYKQGRDAATRQRDIFAAVAGAQWRWPPNYTGDSELMDLVEQLLTPVLARRPTLDQLLEHPVWRRRPLTCPLPLLQTLKLVEKEDHVDIHNGPSPRGGGGASTPFAQQQQQNHNHNAFSTPGQRHRVPASEIMRRAIDAVEQAQAADRRVIAKQRVDEMALLDEYCTIGVEELMHRDEIARKRAIDMLAMRHSFRNPNSSLVKADTHIAASMSMQRSDDDIHHSGGGNATTTMMGRQQYGNNSNNTSNYVTADGFQSRSASTRLGSLAPVGGVEQQRGVSVGADPLSSSSRPLMSDFRRQRAMSASVGGTNNNVNNGALDLSGNRFMQASYQPQSVTPVLGQDGSNNHHHHHTSSSSSSSSVNAHHGRLSAALFPDESSTDISGNNNNNAGRDRGTSTTDASGRRRAQSNALTTSVPPASSAAAAVSASRARAESVIPEAIPRCLNGHPMTVQTTLPFYQGEWYIPELQCNDCNENYKRLSRSRCMFRCMRCDFDRCWKCAEKGRELDHLHTCLKCSKMFVTEAKMQNHARTCRGPSVSQSPVRGDARNTQLWEQAQNVPSPVDFSSLGKKGGAKGASRRNNNNVSNSSDDDVGGGFNSSRASIGGISVGGSLSMGASVNLPPAFDDVLLPTFNTSGNNTTSGRSVSAGRGRLSTAVPQVPSQLVQPPSRAPYKNQMIDLDDDNNVAPLPARRSAGRGSGGDAKKPRSTGKRGGDVDPYASDDNSDDDNETADAFAGRARKFHRAEDSAPDLPARSGATRGRSVQVAIESNNAARPVEPLKPPALSGTSRARSKSQKAADKRRENLRQLEALQLSKPGYPVHSNVSEPRARRAANNNTSDATEDGAAVDVGGPSNATRSKSRGGNAGVHAPSPSRQGALNTSGNARAGQNSSSNRAPSRPADSLQQPVRPPRQSLGESARSMNVSTNNNSRSDPAYMTFFSTQDGSAPAPGPMSSLMRSNNNSSLNNGNSGGGASAAGGAYLALPSRPDQRANFVDEFLRGSWVRHYAFANNDVASVYYSLQPGRYGALYPVGDTMATVVVDIHSKLVLVVPSLRGESNTAAAAATNGNGNGRRRFPVDVHVESEYDEGARVMQLQEAQQVCGTIIGGILDYVTEITKMKAAGQVPIYVPAAYTYQADINRVPADTKFAYLRRVFPDPDNTYTCFRLSNLRSQIICTQSPLDIRWQSDGRRNIGCKYYVHADGSAQPFSVDTTGVLSRLEVMLGRAFQVTGQ